MTAMRVSIGVIFAGFPGRPVYAALALSILISLCVPPIARSQSVQPNVLPVSPVAQDELIPPEYRVIDVRIEGNQRIPEDQIMARLRTRIDRPYDSDLVDADVREIYRMRFFQSVRPRAETTSDGVIVTFQVIERPFIEEIKFVGNRYLRDKALLKESGLAKDRPLDVQEVKMARQRIEDKYQEKGYGHTQVEVLEGDSPDDRRIVFLISEDEPQKITDAEVIGSTFVSGSRLKTFVKSKPGFLHLWGGKLNRQQIEQDKQTLTNYYRSFGFFNARVGTDLIPNENGRTYKLNFLVDEGIRYQVRNISFAGQEKYNADQLSQIITLKSNEFYNAAEMQQDVDSLRDLYGSEGHIAVDVDADLIFNEQDGILDLVYKIKEGPQYRLGNINVHIEGDHGISRRQIVLNRIELKPGDIIDMRKVRAAERRLGSLQLFGNDTRLVVVPREARDVIANLPDEDESGDVFRGQSPDGGSFAPIADIQIR